MLWQVPVTIATSKNKEALKFVLDKASTTITLEGVGPKDWILVCHVILYYAASDDVISIYQLNPGRSGFYRVSYSTDLFSPLLPALGDVTLSPQDRLGILNDAFALVSLKLAMC